MIKLMLSLFLSVYVSLFSQGSSGKNLDIYMDRSRGFLNYTTERNERRGLFPTLVDRLREVDTVEFTTVEVDKEEFESSIDLGKPDIIIGVEDYRRNSREYYYLDDPIELDGLMITRKDFPSIDSKFNFTDKRIIFVEGDKILSKVLEKYEGELNIFSKGSIEEALKSILTGEADIYVEDLQDALRYLADNSYEEGLKLNYLSGPLKTQYYIGGRKRYREVVDRIGEILREMKLDKPYFFKELIQYTEDKIEIHREIEDYVSSNKLIKVFAPRDSNLYPMYYRESSGERAGFLLEYFSEISNVLENRIEVVESDDSKKYDINPFILSINGRELESEGYLTTEPYYNYNIFLFNRIEGNYIVSNEELENYRLAVTKNSIEEKYFTHKSLEENLVVFNSYLEGLRAVSRGEADVFAGTIKRANDTIEANRIKDIKVMGDIDDKISLKLGVSEDKELLYFIMNSFDKTFSYLIPDKNREILNTRLESVKDYKLSVFITLFSLAVLYSLWRHLKNLKEVHGRLKKITFGLVETLESANTYNDEDTGDHVKRINSYSSLLAEKLRMGKTFIDEIGTYASLHDIGKIGISDLILKKPGRLTPEEFEEMKKHSEIGYDMVKNLGVGSIAKNIIRYHHEKWDGSGYPKELSGEEIPIEARIVALADVYDALRQKRAYKEAFSHEKAVEIISSLAGTHFDPHLVDIFLRVNLEFKEIFEVKK